MSRVEKSKKFFGDLLPEDRFTEEAYAERHKPLKKNDNEADKEDSFIDLAGYAACGYEIATGNDAKVDDALMKATLSEYAPIEELASYMGVRD